MKKEETYVGDAPGDDAPTGAARRGAAARNREYASADRLAALVLRRDLIPRSTGRTSILINRDTSKRRQLFEDVKAPRVSYFTFSRRAYKRLLNACAFYENRGAAAPTP